MNYFIKQLLVVSMLIYGVDIAAQDSSENCGAQAKFASINHCDGVTGGEKCISLDLTESLDPLGKEFVYEWDFGDGLTKKGLVVEHCFENYGSYEVSLNLVDPVGGAFIKNELITTVDIRKPFAVAIDLGKVMTNTPANLTYKTNLPAGFIIDEEYWDFGDSTYLCGKDIQHVFHEAKEYHVRFLLHGINPWGDEFRLCTERVIQVEGFLDGVMLEDILAEKVKEMEHIGRYLDDKTHYVIFDKNDHEHFETIKLDGKHGIKVEKDREYGMYAWKGNIFTPIVEFSTKGLNDHDSHDKLREAIETMLESEPVLLESTYFEMNQTSTGNTKEKIDKGLKRTIDKLKKYPYVKVEIGVYTHTGGRVSRNLSISEKRAQGLMTLMISKGLEKSRLSYATARIDRTLLNTCDGTADCDYEDERLNKRADFKIIGFK